MALEHEGQQLEQGRYPVEPASPVLHRAALEAGHRWLARFSPLLDGLEALTAEETRRRLGQIEKLRADGHAALLSLELQGTQADVPLITTVKDALRELDALENDHRTRLGHLAPGDPAAHVDLDRLREKLAEQSAKREVAAWGGSGLAAESPRLELTTSPVNWAAAGMMGIFALGWLSFTTVHALFMIGGMFAAFGWPALALLLFYGIFWAVGFGMAAGAVRSASKEQVELEGRELTVSRKYPFWARERKYTLGPHSRAYLRDSAVRQQGTSSTEISIQDEGGTEIRLAAGRPQWEQQRMVEQINEYLGVSGS